MHSTNTLLHSIMSATAVSHVDMPSIYYYYININPGFKVTSHVAIKLLY